MNKKMFGIVLITILLGFITTKAEYKGCDCVEQEYINKFPGTMNSSWALGDGVKHYITMDANSRPGWVRIWIIAVNDLKKDCKIKEHSLAFEIPIAKDVKSGESIKDWMKKAMCKKCTLVAPIWLCR